MSQERQPSDANRLPSLSDDQIVGVKLDRRSALVRLVGVGLPVTAAVGALLSAGCGADKCDGDVCRAGETNCQDKCDNDQGF
jgi:hypothetical protein